MSIRLTAALGSLSHQRIDDGECREAAEVAIGSPQLADAMIAADRGDASVMDLGTTDAALLKRGAKLRPVAFGLCQENQTRRLKPGFDLIDGGGKRGGRRIDTRMGHDGKKFMYTRPRNRPRRFRFSEFRDLRQSRIMPRRVLAMSVDEQIAIDGDHPPLPW